MSKKLKAKFRVGAIFKPHEGATYLQLNASAVYGTEGENKDFTSVTPWGTLSMGIEEGAPAASVLAVGDEVYLYLEKIEKEELVAAADGDDPQAKKKNTR